MRTVWPTGSALGPNSLSATVWPSTHTLRGVSTSVCVKQRPRHRQLRMSK